MTFQKRKFQRNWKLTAINTILLISYSDQMRFTLLSDQTHFIPLPTLKYLTFHSSLYITSPLLLFSSSVRSTEIFHLRFFLFHEWDKTHIKEPLIPRFETCLDTNKNLPSSFSSISEDFFFRNLLLYSLFFVLTIWYRDEKEIDNFHFWLRIMESFLEAVYKEVTRSLSIGENREIFVRGCKFNEPPIWSIACGNWIPGSRFLMKSIVLPEGISTDFPSMDGSYWFKIGISGKREKPRFRMRLGSWKCSWDLLKVFGHCWIGQKIREVLCDVVGGEAKKSNLETVRSIVVAQTRYCNLGSRINNIISVLTLVSIFPLNFLYRRIF